MLIPAVLLALTLHELAHGWAAYLLGDRTAKAAGRLTLNPIAHLDWVGALCMLLAGVGWAKPVPVDPRQFRMKNPKVGYALVAAAGPLCNLLLAIAALTGSILFRLYGSGSVSSTAADFLSLTGILSIGLGVFNLIPIPPLDGSKLILPIIPNKIIAFVLRYERWISLVFLVVIAAGWLNEPIRLVRNAIYQGICSGILRILVMGGAI